MPEGKPLYCSTCPVIEFRDAAIAALHLSQARKSDGAARGAKPAKGCKLPCITVFREHPGFLHLFRVFQQTGRLDLDVGGIDLTDEIERLLKRE